MASISSVVNNIRGKPLEVTGTIFSNEDTEEKLEVIFSPCDVPDPVFGCVSSFPHSVFRMAPEIVAYKFTHVVQEVYKQ